MRPLSSSRHLRLVVLNVAGLTVAGIVYAAIPDSNGVIHGCYANNGGRLRVIDTSAGGSCNASETALHWNQSGQKGPTGPTGPSDAYTLEGSRGVVPGDGATYTVASGSLPQGSFVVSTTVRIVLGGLSPPGGTFITCLTLVDGFEILDGVAEASIDQAHTTTLPLLGRAIIRAGTSTLTIACRSNQSNVSVTSFTVATKVGTIHDEQSSPL